MAEKITIPKVSDLNPLFAPRQWLERFLQFTKPYHKIGITPLFVLPVVITVKIGKSVKNTWCPEADWYSCIKWGPHKQNALEEVFNQINNFLSQVKITFVHNWIYPKRQADNAYSQYLGQNLAATLSLKKFYRLINSAPGQAKEVWIFQ